MRYSACIEWLFAAEAPVFADRIRLAKDAGLDAVEFWSWSKKDLDAVEAALNETGLPLAGILLEPKHSLVDRSRHADVLRSIEVSLAVAKRLGAAVIIAQTGNVLPEVPRRDQHSACVDILAKAGGILDGSGVILAIEPLNDRIDHPGYYLTSTTEGLDIVDEVARTEIKLLYDIYHAAVMDEPINLLAGRVDRVAHVHLADTDGRNEPGAGSLDYAARLQWLADNLYPGYVGLEYRPTGATLDGLRFRGTVRV